VDGHPERGGFLPPVPLPRRMWTGGTLTFYGDLRVGDAVTRISCVEDVALKQGRTGALCLVTVRRRIEVGRIPLLQERQDIVYRELDAPSEMRKAFSPTEQGAHQRAMKADPTLLFRYSALTFNGHRIHYDQRYATEVEGYSGLAVQGPMQAALLCNYATELRGSPTKHFSFRSLSPLFVDGAFALHASKDGENLKLWIATQNGAVCMTAEAS
jgi:3-methylfumaryl-CoA hydratase